MRGRESSVSVVSDQGGFAAGWYPNPDGGPGLRWFDGERWTDDYHYEPQSLAANPQPGATGQPGWPGSSAPMDAMTPAHAAYQPGPAKNPWEYFVSVLTEHYADFSGRARRSEYWWFWLINLGAIIVLAVVGSAISPDVGPALVGLWFLATLVPHLAVTVRRLHDTNKSGWTILIAIIPVVSLILLIFLLVDGDRGPNRYGYPPK